MDVKLLTNAAARNVCLDLIRTSDHIYIAVAWAGKNSVVDAVIQNNNKVRNMVVGTHMYQTNPDVLRRLMPASQAKYMPPDGPLFHPKVYLFRTGERLIALVGSHNLTASAFDGSNSEASVLIEGAANETVLHDLTNYVEDAWRRAEVIDEEFLFAYEKQYAANKAKRNALRTFRRLKRPRQGTNGPSPLDITWSEFVHRVKGDKYLGLTERLDVLEGATCLFETGKSFAEMKLDERRAIAGTYGSKEIGINGLKWGGFGSMFGQGDFRNLVNVTPRGLSTALDEIPLRGETQQRDYDEFVELFRKAFKGKNHKGGIATASRLLAMKRPDTFVCVSSANRHGLCDAFGTSFSTLDLSNYWDRIIVPMQLSPWWLYERPNSPLEKRIWYNRAALLDSIYYDPSSKASAKN